MLVNINIKKKHNKNKTTKVSHKGHIFGPAGYT